jgi:hypothetical protein
MRGAATALALSLLPYAFALILMPASGDQDGALHAIGAMHPTDPSRVLSLFSRPLFAVPYLVPARLGYAAMRVTTIAVCAGAAWLAFLAARRWGLARPWLAIPLTLLQPCLVLVGTETMTEPVFALTLAGALFALACERIRLAAALFSLLPLARPEGPIVVAVVAVFWLRERRWAAVALLGLGAALWELACVVVTGDPLYLAHTFPWPAVEPSYARGAPWGYVVRWPVILGAGVLALWLAGLRAAWRSPLRIAVAATAAVFVVHSALYTLRGFASTGAIRYFATLAPAAALIALAGAPTVRFAAIAIAINAVQAVVTVDALPRSHYAAATREAMAQAPEATVFADHFGYVFAGRDRGAESPRVGDARAWLKRCPPGTVAVWDDRTGAKWFGLTIDDFASRGWTVVWQRKKELGSRRRSLHGFFTRHATETLHQAVMVKEVEGRR